MNATTRLEYKGKIVTKADIAKMGGISWGTVDARLKAGWSIDRIINTPIRKLKRTEMKKDSCDYRTKDECLNCKRDICIYDEEN